MTRLEKTMRDALERAKQMAQRASSTGLDASIETMPRRVGDTTVLMNVMVVRNG